MKTKFYKELKSILNQNIAYTMLLLLAIASFVWMLAVEIPKQYEMIKWSPLVYAIGLILFIRPNKLIGVASLALCVLYFVKLCVNPITSVLGQFFSIVDRSIVIKNWNHGCFLLGLEWIIIAFTIFIRSSFFVDKLSRIEIGKKAIDHDRIKFFGIFFCGISFVIYMIFPAIRNLLFFIWQDDTSMLAANSGPFLYIFKIFFEIGKPILLFWLYWRISLIKYSIKRKIGQIILIGFTFSFMSDYRIMSILEGTAMLILFLQSNVTKKCGKTIIKIAFSMIAIYAIFMLTTHNDVRNKNLTNLCRLMDIYTGGFMTATAGLNVELDNGFIMFLHDIFNGSYILTGLFGGMYSTTDAINASVNASAKGIFFESIIQARAMFGPLYPLAIALVADFVIRMDYHSVRTMDVLHKLFYIMCGVSTAVFMVMYTYTMIVNFVLYKAFIWLLIVWFDKHVRVTWSNKRLI